MDLQAHIESILKEDRNKTFSQSDQMSLGQIISECKAIQSKGYKCHDGSHPGVSFDFECARPTHFDSWRGIYAELAIGFSFDGAYPELPDFIRMAELAVEETFDGYKGGEYTMSRDTPVWVANWGNSGSTAVIGVKDCGWQVVLETGYRES
jgi:hypothetical protein